MSTLLDVQQVLKGTDAPQPAEAKLAAAIKQAIQANTAVTIYDLHVLVDGGSVTLTGRCNSYHVKKQAQGVAMTVPGCVDLTNDIEVIDVTA
ncbi:MAG: BON domain-containing protein [Candidatus Peribacteraceae bacterium]